MPDNEMSAEERAEWIASRILNAMGVELRESIAAHIKDAESAAQERGRREGLEEAARIAVYYPEQYCARQNMATAIRSRLTKEST